MQPPRGKRVRGWKHEWKPVALALPALLQILGELQGALQRCPFVAGTDEGALAGGTAVLRAVPERAQRQAGVLLQMFMASLPAVGR